MDVGEFDLATSAWIDVTFVDARTPAMQVGLRELFTRATDIVDIEAPMPPAAAGLMRILAALTAQITGLDRVTSAREWEKTRAELLRNRDAGFKQDDIDRVFGDGRGFRLFGSEPFLQDPRLANQCGSRAGANKLQWTRVSGANQVFLSHDTDVVQRPIAAGDAVWHLLAWLYYGPSGMCATRKVGDTSASNTGAGPLRRTLSVHPVGANLYETLLLNQAYAEPAAGVATAPWQADPLNDPLSAPPVHSGLVGLLTRRFRHAVLLVPNDAGDAVVDAYITWAWRHPHGEADDPFTPYQVSKKGERYPLYAKADRAIWRDLDSLILQQRNSHDDRPQVLIELSSLPAEVLNRLRVRAFGYDQDGQTRDKAYFQETTPPILGALKDHGLDDRIRRVHDAAAGCGETLRTALTLAWRNLCHDPKAAEPGAAMADYWARAGRRFWEIVESDSRLPLLPNEFIIIALSVWDTATAAYETGPEAIKTLETHRTRLFRGWRKGPPHDDDTDSRGPSPRDDTDPDNPDEEEW